MLSSSCVVSNLLEPKTSSASQKLVNSSGDAVMEGGVSEDSKGVMGVLEVYIHQARDIQNICIYHKQDVYAKIYLTDDTETTVSTHTVNGGGRNPVFNENLRLDVRKIESSLKCEVWMLSRIKNYLQDQLLGFALVPLTDVVVENGKLTKEFTLSSNDMFHSPSGFVQLTLSYIGTSPELLEISSTNPPLVFNADEPDKEGFSSVPGELNMIEFLDPKIVNENEMMVTEYYGIPRVNLNSGESKSLDNLADDNHLSSEVDAPVVQAHAVESNEVTQDSKIQSVSANVSVCNSEVDAPVFEAFAVDRNEVTDVSKIQTPPNNVSANWSPSVSVVTNSPSDCETSGAPKSVLLSPEEKTGDVAKAADMVSQSVVSPKGTPEDVGDTPVSSVAKAVVNVDVEPEEKVVQQDYVDMYMKSMHQFTEALAKMKLPLDIGTEKTLPEEKDSAAAKEQPSKESGPSPRVFYGSRAFF